MYESFENLPEQRQSKILDACIQEFAEKGFANASTNEIVKQSGISKGILFHYFGTKKKLFLYVLDQAIDRIASKFYEQNQQHPDDIFERLIYWSVQKIKLSHEEPLLFQLIVKAFMQPPDDLKEDLEERWERLKQNNMSDFISNIDITKFRSGIQPEKAIELLIMMLDALANKYIPLFKNKPNLGIDEMEEITKEYQEYIEILKGGIYGAV